MKAIAKASFFLFFILFSVTLFSMCDTIFSFSGVFCLMVLMMAIGVSAITGWGDE